MRDDRHEERADWISLAVILVMSLVIATAVIAFLAKDEPNIPIGPEPQTNQQESPVVSEQATPARRGASLEGP